MLELHIANKNYSSWSLRPWVLLRELGIPFIEVLHPFEPDSDWSDFRALSPSGKVPCLVDGDVVVWDSLAIVEYLYERFPIVWPSASTQRAASSVTTAITGTSMRRTRSNSGTRSSCPRYGLRSSSACTGRVMTWQIGSGFPHAAQSCASAC